MSNAQTEIVKAMKGWSADLKSFSEPPKGMFGRKAIIRSGNITLDADEIDFDFQVPFDDDMEANEAEIIVYNLTDTTANTLKYNGTLTIEAGYGNDTGVIFAGFVSSVKTKRDRVDKITTIKALDSFDLSKRDVIEKTYAAGTKASYILRDLLSQSGLPIAAFKPRIEWTYKDEQKVSGNLLENIKKYAETCGISTYINKGRVYARHLYEGDNINFTACPETGLIESPEEFEEEVNTDSHKGIIRGYKFKMLLQHCMTTAAIINLRSYNANGSFRVRSGKHIFNESESVTEVEVVTYG